MRFYWYCLIHSTVTKMADLEVMKGKINFKFAIISETVRANFLHFQSYCMQSNKFWNFWFLGHMTLKVTCPWKHKFAVITETVRDKAKGSNVFTLARDTECKITNFEFSSILRSHDPLRSHDLENVNLSLSHKP